MNTQDEKDGISYRCGVFPPPPGRFVAGQVVLVRARVLGVATDPALDPDCQLVLEAIDMQGKAGDPTYITHVSTRYVITLAEATRKLSNASRH